MRRTIELIKLDCNIERFAEVFGDDIETEDCTEFLKLALKSIPSSEFKDFGDCATPSELFGAIDYTVSEELANRNPRRIFGDRTYFLLRAFYRFAHDSYLWGDLEDLERWADELFESLENSEQKNFEPRSYSADELDRELLYLKFLDYLCPKLAEPVFNMVVESVQDWRESEGVE